MVRCAGLLGVRAGCIWGRGVVGVRGFGCRRACCCKFRHFIYPFVHARQSKSLSYSALGLCPSSLLLLIIQKPRRLQYRPRIALALRYIIPFVITSPIPFYFSVREDISYFPLPTVPSPTPHSLYDPCRGPPRT